jgi:hypothetical protein
LIKLVGVEEERNKMDGWIMNLSSYFFTRGQDRTGLALDYFYFLVY